MNCVKKRLCHQHRGQEKTHTVTARQHDTLCVRRVCPLSLHEQGFAAFDDSNSGRETTLILTINRGLCGQAKLYDKAYRYIKKRTRWMRYHLYRRQCLPLGSGITEAACKIVFTQRLKRSGMSWTIEGGQVILDLRVIKLSRVWEAVHQRYLASKPMPIVHLETAKGLQNGLLAA